MADNNEKLTQAKRIEKIYTCLLGIDGTKDTGLVGAVERAFQRIEVLENGRRKLWLIVGLLVGGGAAGSNADKILSILSG